MEAELLRSKQDMMCLNNQLLDAIHRKLELSQELEAWQVSSPFLPLLNSVPTFSALKVLKSPS